MRFTVRRMMVVVLLIGLNLAAAIATSKFYPRPASILPVLYGSGKGYTSYLKEDWVEYGEGNAETGSRRTRVERLTPRPTLSRIWSPVVASLGVSLLTLGVAWRRSGSRSP